MSLGDLPIAPIHDMMAAWRHELHARPQLGFEQTRIAAKVAQLLEDRLKSAS